MAGKAIVVTTINGVWVKAQVDLEDIKKEMHTGQLIATGMHQRPGEKMPFVCDGVVCGTSDVSYDHIAVELAIEKEGKRNSRHESE